MIIIISMEELGFKMQQRKIGTKVQWSLALEDIQIEEGIANLQSILYKLEKYKALI